MGATHFTVFTMAQRRARIVWRHQVQRVLDVATVTGAGMDCHIANCC